MLTRLKKKIQAMLTVEAEAAHKIGLTPNMISAIGIILALLSSIAYAKWDENQSYLLLATGLLLLSGFCDALDGVVARLYEQSTPFGGFLDSLLDRYADAAVYAGIIVGGLCDPLWGLAALTNSLLVSYSRAKAEASNIGMESIGVAERAERIIILATATITAFFWQPTIAMNIGISLLAILSALTVIQRGIHVYGELKKKKS
jgi:archaetidylinositol phosphate synthase